MSKAMLLPNANCYSKRVTSYFYIPSLHVNFEFIDHNLCRPYYAINS